MFVCEQVMQSVKLAVSGGVTRVSGVEVLFHTRRYSAAHRLVVAVLHSRIML